MKPTKWAVTLLACLAFSVAMPLTAFADGVVTLNPDETEVDGTQRFTLAVELDETGDFMGIQFSLTFNTAHLQVVRVSPGDVWPVGGTFVAINDFDNSAGAVEFAATLTGAQQTVEGAVAEILFEAVDPAVQVTTGVTAGTSLDLEISGPGGASIAATAPADQTITINPAPAIAGTVSLQAPDSRTIAVNVSNLPYQDGQAIADGDNFDLAVPTASDYTLRAGAPCHVSAVKTNVSAPSTGHNTTLLAGDVNGDDRVNIQDLAAIGSRFGETGVTTCANMNADPGGVVNILDLSLTAGNYGESGPRGW